MARNLSHQPLHRTSPNPSQDPATVRSPAHTNATGKEAITLPSRDSTIRHAHEVIQDAPELRKELVAQLRQAVAIGSLVLDSQSLADKLIGIQLHDIRSAA